MADWSRRKALSAIAGGLAVPLAGCTDSASETDTPPLQRPVDDYESRHVRTPTLTTLWEEGQTLDREEMRPGYTYIAREEALADLQFNTDVDAGAKLASFVRETDFTSESVYLYEGRVSECHEIRIRQVYREGDGAHVYFCRAVRPADVACSTGTTHAVGIAIRLPFAIDGQGTGQGMGMRSGCIGRPEPVDLDPTTPTNGSDPEGGGDDETDAGNVAPLGGED